MPESPDAERAESSTDEATTAPPSLAKGSQPAKALTSDEREALLADNRRTREELRAKEAAKNGIDDDDDDAAPTGDAGLGDTDPSRVPGKVPATTRSRAASRRKVVTGVLVALVVALAISTGVLAYLYATEDGGETVDSAAATSALADAQKYAAEIVTYQAGDYSNLDQRIRQISTKDFADRYVQSSQEARKGNDAAKASSVGTAVGAGLQKLTGDEAVVLVALDQKVTSPELPSAGKDGIDYQSRVLITLHRDGDRWVVADLDTI